MRNRKLDIKLASVLAAVTMAAIFAFWHSNFASGYAQETENQQGIGAAGTMGFLIESVEPGSPAEQVGLMPGDVILSVGKRRIQSAQDMRDSLRRSLNNTAGPLEVVFLRYDPSVRQVVNRVVMVTPRERGAQTVVRTETISGGVLNDKAIEKPLPPYPAVAKAAGASGTVTVNVIVDEEGRVEKAKAISGHPLLRQAAVEAAYQARFTPTKLSGAPVKVSGVITYDFVLP
ncbi:MAG TPA: TonB family protein [Pyrinomonadaceae bacterium]|nr:TonB family protein [Pyrinomonadaceae bacterium]